MKPLFKSQADFLEAALFPFKAYIIAAPIAVLICRILQPAQPVHLSGHELHYLDKEISGFFSGTVERLYFVSLIALLCGAMAAVALRDKKSMKSAFLDAGLSLLAMAAFASYVLWGAPDRRL